MPLLLPSLLIFSGEGDRLGKVVAPMDTDQAIHALLGTKRAGKHSLEQDWADISTSPAERGSGRGGVGWVGVAGSEVRAALSLGKLLWGILWAVGRLG